VGIGWLAPSSAGRKTLRLPTAAVYGILYALRWRACILFDAMKFSYEKFRKVLRKFLEIFVAIATKIATLVLRVEIENNMWFCCITNKLSIIFGVN